MKTSDIAKASLALHKKLRGKIQVSSTVTIKNRQDLALAYTPGVGAVSSAIAKNPKLADDLTWRRNVVAVVSDGSAVLGLGNIGPLAALPVMEGKCAIFKQFAGVNAIPIVLATQDTEEIIATIKALEPSFGAIQMEDISAPRCFEIEQRLSKELSIPVMHDDQHGTAIVILGGLMNATKIVKKDMKRCRIVLNGSGAAGTASAKLLLAYGVKDLICCDTKGIISKSRTDLNSAKKELLSLTNPRNISGSLADAVRDADALIGISAAGAFSVELVQSMKKNPIVFALANPIPELLPAEAEKAGVAVYASGRSDFQNQLNNALVYPGLFRGMLQKRISSVTTATKLRAAKALAEFIKKPNAQKCIPSMFDRGLHEAITKSVK